jgi:hypothetical protein
LNFDATLFSDGKETTIKKFIHAGTNGVFVFAQEKNIVYHKLGSGETMRLGVAKIVDQFDERFLMVHALNEGQAQYYN